jgi:MOSC domain-containing protein YiiM
VTAAPAVVSVNVGERRTVTWRDHEVVTAIWKEPVQGPVAVAGVNLTGDDQADRRVHGGPDKAVYAYSVEDYAWWADELGHPVALASFGENLTTAGLDLTAARVGDRWRVGSAVLEVAQPREPCFKLGIRMGDDAFPGRFEAARRPGAYLRVVEPGELQAGDAIVVDPAAEPAVALGQLVRTALPLELIQVIATDPRVPEGWRMTAARALRDPGDHPARK